MPAWECAGTRFTIKKAAARLMEYSFFLIHPDQFALKTGASQWQGDVTFHDMDRLVLIENPDKSQPGQNSHDNHCFFHSTWNISFSYFLDNN